MEPRSLFDPVIDSGLRNPHFFEGRLLTAESLREDQKAHRERQRLSGQALGAGVVRGLEVTLEPLVAGAVRRTVRIGQGVALNQEGELLVLRQDIRADVVPPSAPPEAPASLFARCEPSPVPVLPSSHGLYLLVMSPASGFRERAPKSGLGQEDTIIGCGDRYAVDGVKFRLEPLAPALLAGDDAPALAALDALLAGTANAAQRSRLRNLCAHLLIGAGERMRFARDPFAREGGGSALTAYGALDRLRALERLSRCDVPLSFFLWHASGIAYMDLWAVRRRPVAAGLSAEWPALEGLRARAEAEALRLQFQAQLADVLGEADDLSAISAQDFFRYLPPAGLLPVIDVQRPRGVTVPGFFAGRTWRGPVFMEGARLSAIFEAALPYPPLDLEQQEMVWVYLTRENRAPAGQAAAPPFALFASGQLPFFGEARFDVNRWNYANYVSLNTR